MLTWRFAVHLNRSLVELVGLVIEKTEVAYLKSFPCKVVKKTFQVTCGVVSFQIQGMEFYQILSRAGIFEPLTDIDDFTICPTQMSGGVVVPIVDVECLKRCPAIVKEGLSRFQKPVGELASVYHS